jgi:Carboxypeptidase regulatory-like domain
MRSVIDSCITSILAGVLLCLTAISLLAQTTSGNIAGVIYDPTGATIPNANIVARNDATGVDYAVKSTSTGEYRIPNLPAGSYTITVTAPGFAKAEMKNAQVTVNQVATANLSLTVASAGATVEVTAAGSSIDTTTQQIQNSFSSTPLAELPTASQGSGVINLSLLNAGVASSGGVGVGTGPSVGGQRPRNNNFTIEGIDNNNDSITGPVVTLPNDSVDEFTVLQNQYMPEFGHSSGGQFNQTVKSGTNSLHGAAYEYLINRNFNAADNLSAVEGTPLHPRFDNNRFGGNAGGPIIRNKLFWFVDYEYNPIGSNALPGLVYAPTANGWNTIAGIPGISQSNMTQLKTYLGTASSAVPAASIGGYPLVGPGNASLGQQSPSAVPIELGQLPIIAPNFTNNEAGVASVDYNISSTDSLRGRFILNRSGTIDTAATLPAFYTTSPVNGYIGTLSEYHNFGPALVNEFRLGYNRFEQNLPAGNFKWPGLDQFPNVEVFELNAQLGPDPNAPQFTIQNTYQATDNLSWTKGSHSFKFGFDGYRLISPQSFTQRSRGDYEWSFLSDYLFDYTPDFVAQRSLGNATYYGNRTWLGLFASDSYKVRPNLTVDVGVRWEYLGVPQSENEQTLNAISNVPGLITFSQPTAQKNAIMPRVGLAYSPGKNGTTSIRAGFGINYDVLYDNLGLLTLPPQITTTVDVTGSPAGSFLAGGGIPPNSPSTSLSQADARAGTGGFVPNQQRPEALQWNIGIQHTFAHNFVAESRYVGTRGIFLPVQVQLNRQPVVNASNALPLYLTAPSQATLDALPNTLSALTSSLAAGGNIVPGYLAAGFTGIITSYQPWGSSTYHGWANQVSRRFSDGFQMQLAYTYSHDIDNSTADVFSTYLTPRRPEDSQNLGQDRSSSALDHRQRLSATAVYDVPWFKHSNWALKNLAGNWEVAPIYTYQTGTLVTVQSGVDSNLNGDSAPDRAFVNPGGAPNIGSNATPLLSSAGQTVAYLATNPNAGYIIAPKGTLPNGGRNTEHLNPINNIDMTLAKAFSLTERYKIQFAARFINILNHSQYVGGFISDVAPIGFTGTAEHNFLIPNTSLFMNPSQVFSSNPRTVQFSAKFTF